MTHGRKPRRPRPVRAMPLHIARNRAARLTDAERCDTMAPAIACLDALRTGTASEDHHTVLHTQLRVAQGIEASGIVRGLQQVFAEALQAMDTIRERALARGAWRPTALYAGELTALQEAVHLHDYQLQQLSAGELHAVARKLIAQTLSGGGEVRHCTANDVLLESTR